MRKVIFMSAVYCSLIGPLVAQTSISSTEFIQQYLAVVNTSKDASSLPDDFKTIWLEELEFRTQTRDFDIDQQRYTLRFKPTTKKIRNAQTNLSNLLDEEFLLKKTNFGNALLVDAYKEWLELVMLEKKIRIYNDLLIIYEDIEKVLLKLSQVDPLNVKEFLEVKSDISKTNIAIQTSEKVINDYLLDMHINVDDLLSLKELKTTLTKQLLSSPSLISQQQERNKHAILEAEIALEQVEQQQLFDFFQIQYQGPHTDGLEERISIGTSINIPFSSKRSLKIQELQLEQLILSEEMQFEQVVKKDKINKEKIKLARLIDNYTFAKTQLQAQKQDANKFLAKMTEQEGVTPLLLLYNKVEEEKRALDMLKLEDDIYNTYIDYLEVSEFLFIVPFRNFLVAEE